MLLTQSGIMGFTRGMGLNPEAFGNIFDDDFTYADITAFNASGNYTVVGTAPTIDSSGMTLPSRTFVANGFATNVILRNYWHRFQTYSHFIEFDVTSPDATMLGPYVGAYGGQIFWNVFAIWQNISAGNSRVVIYVSDAAGTYANMNQSSGVILPVVGRTYRLTFDATLGAQGAVYTATLTDGGISTPISATWSENVATSSGGTTKYAHKTARPAVSTAEVQAKITRWSFSTDNLLNIPNLLIGDSITWGLCATTYAGGFARQVFPSGDYSISAGPSDKIADVAAKMSNLLAYNSPRIFLFIGRNDIAIGTALATVQSEYQAIVTSLKSTGAQVVHIGPLNTGGNFDLFNAWLPTEYPSDIVLDFSAAMVGNFAADGVHPNQDGHDIIAAGILSAI